MNNIQNNIPRNSIFMILLIMSLITAYFSSDAVLYMLTAIFNIDLSPAFMDGLTQSSLWAVAGYWCVFSFLIFTFAFLIPAVYNVVNLVKLKNKLSTMPRAKDKAAPVTKEFFLNSMMDFKFIYNDFIVPYCEFLYEGKKDKKPRKANLAKRHKSKEIKEVIVNAMVPAEQVFKIDELFKARLSNWFMAPLPLILLGVGFLTLILSIVSMLQVGGDEFLGEEARAILSIGYLAFSACIAVAIFIAAFHKILTAYLSHRGAEIIKMIDGLFHYKPAVDTKNIDLSSIEIALRKTVSSFKELTSSLGQQQEQAVNQLIIKSMDDYVKKIGKSAELQSKSLQKTLDDTATRIEQFSNSVAVNLDKMNDNENKTYNHIGENIEKLITSLNGEVKNLSSLSITKGDILGDLNKTAADLKSVSSASDGMIQKFDDMAVGLAHLLSQVEKMAPMSGDRREKLSLELRMLKENNKTVGMSRKNGTKDNNKT